MHFLDKQSSYFLIMENLAQIDWLTMSTTKSFELVHLQN